MKTDIGIWEIDRTSQAGTKLDLAARIETEDMLEAVLVANPEMLMQGLTLVGRQVPVETGFVDLLGIDEDGRLVVFELKRGENPSGPQGWSESAWASMPAQPRSRRTCLRHVALRISGIAALTSHHGRAAGAV